MSVSSQERFSFERHQELKQSDRPRLEFLLGAMYLSAFYAHGSIGCQVICASPIPIPGSKLIDLVAREIDKPPDPMRPKFEGNDHVAFALMNALRTKSACEQLSRIKPCATTADWIRSQIVQVWSRYRWTQAGAKP